jgi:hypothetical protein
VAGLEIEEVVSEHLAAGRSESCVVASVIADTTRSAIKRRFDERAHGGGDATVCILGVSRRALLKQHRERADLWVQASGQPEDTLG